MYIYALERVMENMIVVCGVLMERDQIVKPMLNTNRY